MASLAKRTLAAAVCAVTLATLGPATAAATTWNVSVWGPRRSLAFPFEWYAKEVAARTGGQLKMEFTYDRDKTTDSPDLLKSGARDGAYFCSSYLSDKLPLLTVLDLPMLAPRSISALGRVELALADQPAIQAELKKWNAKMLIPTPMQQYQLMGTRRIAKMDDFRGAKVRVFPEMGKVLEEYGASVYKMSPFDTFAAMKSGQVDVVALPYPYSFATYKIDDAAKYVTDNISLGVLFCYLAANQKSWDALPAKTQQIMLDLRQPAVAQYDGIFASEDARTIAAFKQKGLEYTSFNPTDRARLLARVIKVWQAWVVERNNQGLKGAEVLEFTQAKIREFGQP
jgi:TRAP-type C4-dicarboxylate transport system substrate-binding protein